MVNRIIKYSLIFFCIVATALAVTGVSIATVTDSIDIFGDGTWIVRDTSWYNIRPLNNDFWDVFRSIDASLKENGIVFKIPQIDLIPQLNSDVWYLVILNAFINFTNGLFNVINVLSKLINILLELIQTLVIFIGSFFAYISGFATP